MSLSDFLTLDLMPLLAATLASVSCGLLGNYLVLRRESLLGDAISHAVLPGIVVAFLVGISGGPLIQRLTGGDARSPVLMLLGAGLAGIAAVVLIELVKRVGRVEPGAAMGVVFSVFFAAGVYLMQQVARNVDLDADCVLYGQLEGLIWIMPGAPLAPESLAQIPRQVVTLGIVLLLAIGFVIAFYKELRISSFDPELATSLGFRASWISSALLVLIAAATVASFEAVGSILVIAMLICPAATARMFTDRLRTQLLLSVTLAILSATAGYALAALLPSWIGISGSLSAAGMITVTAGMFFTLAAIAAPAHGILPRMMHRRTLARRVDLEDLLGTLYRLGESGHERPSAAAIAGARLNSGRIQAALESAERSGFVHRSADGIGLTERGSAIAGALVRRHRLWERYLVDRAGFSPDHVHDPAEQLEHLVDLESERPVTGAPLVDPHGRFIPPRADPNG